jgi:hypothetical protein
MLQENLFKTGDSVSTVDPVTGIITTKLCPTCSPGYNKAYTVKDPASNFSVEYTNELVPFYFKDTEEIYISDIPDDVQKKLGIYTLSTVSYKLPIIILLTILLLFIYFKFFRSKKN